MKTIRSRNNYDTNGYEIDLIKNLKLIKTKLQTERWIESWNKDESKVKMGLDNINEWDEKDRMSVSIMLMMQDTFAMVNEMVKNNDCYVATKVSRTLMKLGGKVFQGISNLVTS